MLLLTGHTLKDSEYTMKYHRGELLTAAEMAGATLEERAQHAQMRREPVVLEPSADAVLRLLDAALPAVQTA